MWDEKLSDLRTKIAKNWDPKRTDDQQSFKSKLSLTRVLILVPDPSASDETGDEEKVKKKQKTMSNKRKETTRVNIPALKGRFFRHISGSLYCNGKRQGRFHCWYAGGNLMME